MITLQKSPEMDAFFQRCWNNIQQEHKNSFLGRSVTKESESTVQEEMKEAGFPEFSGPKSTWPSLFLSSKQWENSPYHSSIQFHPLEGSNFHYEKETIQVGELFNVDAIQMDPQKECNEWMKLRALDAPVEAIYLLQGDDVWMVDAPSEACTNDPIAAKVKGNVCTFGLGIGYFLFMALQNPAVTSVTVVENSPEVISLFEKIFLPQFPKEKPIHILHADAFEKWNADFLNKFDSVYVDIWQSEEDGLEKMTHLLQQYQPSFESTDFWIEDSILQSVMMVVFLYMDGLYYSHPAQVSTMYQGLLSQVQSYFQAINQEIHDPKIVSNILYDRTILRNILAQSK